MDKIKKILFVAGSGTGRAPMASEIMKQTLSEHGIGGVVVEARGMVVQFPEPMNPKALAVLASHGIQADEYHAVELSDGDIEDGTLVLCMKQEQRPKLISDYSHLTEDNTFVLSGYVGDEIEIINPYGGSVQRYGLCFEVIKKVTEKLVDKLFAQQ